MGSQCTSELMAKVSRMLYIRQLATTQYHPMCNGLVDRFNGTLKHYTSEAVRLRFAYRPAGCSTRECRILIDWVSLQPRGKRTYEATNRIVDKGDKRSADKNYVPLCYRLERTTWSSMQYGKRESRKIIGEKPEVLQQKCKEQNNVGSWKKFSCYFQLQVTNYICSGKARTQFCRD